MESSVYITKLPKIAKSIETQANKANPVETHEHSNDNAHNSNKHRYKRRYKHNYRNKRSKNHLTRASLEERSSSAINSFLSAFPSSAATRLARILELFLRPK